MNLSNDLVEQFVKATNEEVKERQNETLYGTAVVFEGKMYARLDGSQQLTPIKTTTNIREGDRVIVSVQRHSAVVTGNISSPSASIEDLSDSSNNTIATCKELISTKVSTDDLEAATARIGVLETDYAIINGNLEAANANITKLEANKLEAKSADLKYATIENLNATNANVKNLTANHAEFEKAVASDFEATNASIKKLDADKLNATDANLKYANIDFSNIKIAAIENLYATSGIIKDIVVSDQRITGTLVGVTITGDLIEGNTVVADKLVIKGSDGLYYKLNTDGITTEAQQTDYNSLNGSIIKAKSITATKVDVTDLVAFGATIGGLKIENGSIHSVSKDSASNTTRGLFFGKDGQAAIGDGTNFLKYFKDSDGNYKLAISADTITIKGGQKNLNTELDEINKKVNSVKSIKNTEVTYQAGTSGTTAPTGTWNKTIPSVANGQYLWSRTVTTYTDDSTSTVYSVSKMGVKGADGKGIKSTTITYQISGNATSIPTGTWVSSVPKATVAAPYLWTKTVITYTDNTSSTAYSVGSSVDGVMVGGRNLIRGSGKLSTDYVPGNGTVVTSGYNGAKAVATKGAWTGYYIHMLDIANRANLKAGDVVTMSIWVSTDSTTEITSPGLYLYRANSEGNAETKSFGGKKLKAGTWVQLSCTYTINADRKLQNGARFESSKDTTYNILWSAPKLELGNKATDWTPAPEDQVEKGKVVDEVNSELKIDGKSIALKTGHFTVDSKNLTLDSAGNATFSGKIKGASVEASTFNGGTFTGGTFTGNEFNGGSGWFNRGFAVKGNGGGDADFSIDSNGNGQFERNLTVFGKGDFRSDVDILNTLSVTGAINSSNDISGRNVYGTNITLMKDKIDDTASVASTAKTAAANAQSTADAAQATANNKPSWDAVNGKANTDTVKNVIKWRAQSRQLSLAANGEDYWNFWDLCSLDGYTRTAMIVSISGSASSYMMQYQHTYNDNGTQIRCRNFASWAFNGSIYVAVLYVHEGYC